MITVRVGTYEWAQRGEAVHANPIAAVAGACLRAAARSEAVPRFEASDDLSVSKTYCCPLSNDDTGPRFGCRQRAGSSSWLL